MDALKMEIESIGMRKNTAKATNETIKKVHIFLFLFHNIFILSHMKLSEEKRDACKKYILQ